MELTENEKKRIFDKSKEFGLNTPEHMARAEGYFQGAMAELLLSKETIAELEHDGRYSELTNTIVELQEIRVSNQVIISDQYKRIAELTKEIARVNDELMRTSKELRNIQNPF